MKFGVGFPTCREGTSFPVPYVQAHEFASLARAAEALGYYSLWGNDHLTPSRAIQATQAEPPNFFEPLITYASLANITERLRFVLGVVVLPQREPVLLAKQLATLDQLTNGRVMFGVGIGGYREEFESVHPGRKGANRGAMLEEGIEALRVLFSERKASYSGKYLQFADVQLAPKPVQNPFPVYINAHGSVALRRVARMAEGWIVAAMPVPELEAAKAEIKGYCDEIGRDPASVSINFQIWVCFGRDQDEALEKLQRSQHFRRMVARDPARDEAAVLEKYRAGNLFGSPEQVIAQIRAYEQAGIGHMGLVFLGDTTAALQGDMQLFAERIMPAFESA